MARYAMSPALKSFTRRTLSIFTQHGAGIRGSLHSQSLHDTAKTSQSALREWFVSQSSVGMFSRQYCTNQSLSCHPLVNRTLIRAGGKDCRDFLQGLITNDMALLDDPVDGEGMDASCMYSMMLNIQGRVLYDMLVYRLPPESDHPVYLIECDTGVASELVQTMKRYKIRKKVSLDTVGDEYKLWVILPQEGSTGTVTLDTKAEVITMVTDPRLPEFGQRVVTRGGVTAQELLASGAFHTDDLAYTQRRYKVGLGEGILDFPPANCTPLESNAVFHNGVSFTKGCYIGQELTARTHHTGVIRKRLMPLTIFGDSSDIKPGATVETSAGKKCGKFRSAVSGHGLALLRLGDVIGQGRLVCKDGEKTIEMETSVPSWWPRDSDEIIKQALSNVAKNR